MNYLYADIILPLPLNRTFTWIIPPELESEAEAGKRALVQFGVRKILTGVIRRVHNVAPEYSDLKSIIAVLDEIPIVAEMQFIFWEWLADYYMCSEGDVMKSALPSGFKLESESHVVADEAFTRDMITEKTLYGIFDIIEKNPGLSIKDLSGRIKKENILPILRKLIDLDAIHIEERFQETHGARKEKFIALNTGCEYDPVVIEKRFSSAPRQKDALLEVLKMLEQSAKLPLSVIAHRFGHGTINSLITKGFLLKIDKEPDTLMEPAGMTLPEKLTEIQAEAFESVRRKFLTHDVVLLHGVTSSGKTEIYIHLISEIISQGRQVLYLLPEIALTAQIINRLRNVFGGDVGIYHSRLSDKERIAVYRKMAGMSGKEYSVILGARSAVFLPFSKLGLVIVDEEHETSYKQFDPAPRYHARDAAIVLSSFYKAKTLLGTATPSVETYANCINGKYELTELTERFGNIKLPEILVADIRDARKRRTMRSVFTPALLKETEIALNSKKQVILFQNRRGFSSFIECESCGWIPKCSNCDVSLTYHKFNSSLMCHYCGKIVRVPSDCPVCGSQSITTRGFGTELIEDEIAIIFPGVKVARLDLDTSRVRNSYERIIDDFARGRCDILVGTQMLSKGLDFDNVSLVGIINADQMLNYPDFRAFERSFQLMAQVSGRAGRRESRGKVIIQTTDPENPIIKYVRENDFRSMFAGQVEERQMFGYPPFVRMIKLSIKHRESQQVNHISKLLADELRMIFGKRVFGPNPPVVGRISNFYIMDIILKIEKKSSFSKARKMLRDILNDAGKSGLLASARIAVDVDPF